MFLKNHIFPKITIAVLLLLGIAEQSLAIPLPFRLTWNRNAEPDLAFYTVYYGPSPGNYTHLKDVTNLASPSIEFCDINSADCDYTNVQITPGADYYLTVTASDRSLNESDFATPLRITVDRSPVTSTTSTIRSSTTSIPITSTTSTIGPSTTSTPTTIPGSTTTISSQHSITYEDGEDETADRWYIYDNLPEGAQISNAYDSNRQSRVISFSGSRNDNGYRLRDTGKNLWNNSSHFVIQWSMKYAEFFIVYIDLNTTAGHRYLTYKPLDYDQLGLGEYVEQGLGSDAINGQWHTFVRDLRADLAQSQPGVTILEVNGFLIRGSGSVDDIALLNYFPSATTTTVSPNQGEYCSPDLDLVLDGTAPEEGTMSITIPDAALPQHSMTYEDAQDGSTEGWSIYDSEPAGAQISNVFDSDRQTNVMQFSGAGADNGYRLRNSDGTVWNNTSHFIIKWDMKYSEPFTLYVDLDTTAGHRYLTYRPLNTNSLGDAEYVLYGLGTDANDGRWHTFVRDLQADLKVAQPGATILAVNGFLIRGSGRVDDIALLTVQQSIFPSLRLTLFDADTAGEGVFYLNGNGPINLPTGSYNNLEHTFTVSINRAWLLQGENSFRFMHTGDQGYELRNLCVTGLLAGSTTTTTTGIPPPTTTTTPRNTTTTVISDVTPPMGSIAINQGESVTNLRLVTLNLSGDDETSGMGSGAQMMLSNDNEKWFGPKPFAPTKTWVLSVGEGVKTVYAKFSDAAGNWMNEPVTDSIELTLSCSEPIQLEPAAINCSGSYLNLWSDEKAVDGKPFTGWLSPLRRFLQEEYITLDLGEVKIINRIDIRSKRFAGRDLFPSDFTVQVSTDMQSWTDVVVVQDYTLPAARTDSWTFDGAEARYVKLVATGLQKFMFFYYVTYITEIEVYGCAEPETPEPESLAATQSAGKADLLLSKEAFDREVAARKGTVIEGTAPGRPGKPLFILKENE